jgi:hypothetical protein
MASSRGEVGKLPTWLERRGVANKIATVVRSPNEGIGKWKRCSSLPEAKGGVNSPEFRGCSEGPSLVIELEMMHVVWLLGHPTGL